MVAHSLALQYSLETIDALDLSNKYINKWRDIIIQIQIHDSETLFLPMALFV